MTVFTGKDARPATASRGMRAEIELHSELRQHSNPPSRAPAQHCPICFSLRFAKLVRCFQLSSLARELPFATETFATHLVAGSNQVLFQFCRLWSTVGHCPPCSFPRFKVEVCSAESWRCHSSSFSFVPANIPPFSMSSPFACPEIAQTWR